MDELQLDERMLHEPGHQWQLRWIQLFPTLIRNSNNPIQQITEIRIPSCDKLSKIKQQRENVKRF